jgi:hypothetical protein
MGPQGMALEESGYLDDNALIMQFEQVEHDLRGTPTNWTTKTDDALFARL